MNETQVDTIRTAWLFILIGLAVAIPIKFILDVLTVSELFVSLVIFGAGFVLVFGKFCIRRIDCENVDKKGCKSESEIRCHRRTARIRGRNQKGVQHDFGTETKSHVSRDFSCEVEDNQRETEQQSGGTIPLDFQRKRQGNAWIQNKTYSTDFVRRI